MAAETAVWLVWGCGVWPERRQLVDPQWEGCPVHEDHPDFALLPAAFIREWGERLGSEHWAEIIRATEADICQSTSRCANVYGCVMATGQREP